jgi:hypothetical protein
MVSDRYDGSQTFAPDRKMEVTICTGFGLRGFIQTEPVPSAGWKTVEIINLLIAGTPLNYQGQLFKLNRRLHIAI